MRTSLKQRELRIKQYVSFWPNNIWVLCFLFLIFIFEQLKSCGHMKQVQIVAAVELIFLFSLLYFQQKEEGNLNFL